MEKNTYSILVVDDEPDLEMLIKQKLRKRLSNGNLALFFARDGVDALEFLDQNDHIDVILTDINMPRMDGLTLLDELQQKKHPYRRSLVVSAYGDMDNIRTAMNRGAFDFIVKPIDFNDLEKTLDKTFADVSELKSSSESKKELEYVKFDLETASVIQRSLIPSKFPALTHIPEIEIFGRMDTAKEVGGDFYDFFQIDENRVGLVIADVSGKGAQAAIYMAVTRTILRTMAKQVAHPAECLHRVNQTLIPESAMNSFVTIWYGVLNRKTGVLQYSNGGHNLPYLKKVDGSVINLEDTDGMLVGKFNFADYDAKKLVMDKGDTLVLYTDGIPEAMNKDMTEYSDERFLKLLEKMNPESSLDDMIKEIYDEVHTHADGYPQSDDITMLMAQYQ